MPLHITLLLMARRCFDYATAMFAHSCCSVAMLWLRRHADAATPLCHLPIRYCHVASIYAMPRHALPLLCYCATSMLSPCHCAAVAFVLPLITPFSPLMPLSRMLAIAVTRMSARCSRYAIDALLMLRIAFALLLRYLPLARARLRHLHTMLLLIFFADYATMLLRRRYITALFRFTPSASHIIFRRFRFRRHFSRLLAAVSPLLFRHY